MFAFVDESGNTGHNLFDPAQPIFSTLAVMTQQDFDKTKGSDVAKLAALVGAAELHGGDLGVTGVETIAPGLLSILKSAHARFAFSRVEKRYLLTSKIFDALFDHGENLGAHPHVYLTRPLRLFYMFELGAFLPDPLARNFWTAMMAKEPVDATAGLVTFCDDVLALLASARDKRFIEVVGDTVRWARDNPEAIYLHSASKQSRQGHMPNTVGFGNLMDGIERQSKLWRSPIALIRHDEQDEFGAALSFWHDLYSKASPEEVEISMGEKFVMQKGYGSRLELTSSTASAGIQATDVLLWLFGRATASKPIGENGWRLLRWALRKSAQTDFSFEGVGAIAERQYGWMVEHEPSEAALDRGRSFLAASADLRADRVRDYEARKRLAAGSASPLE